MDETDGGHGAARLSRRARGLLVIAAVGVILAVLAVVAVVNTGSGSRRPAGNAAATPSASSPGSAPVVAGPSPPKVGKALMLGNPKAPVTMVEFGDFGCPYCGKFARQVEPRLVRKYVKTGVVQLVWRDFPHTTEWSFEAAVAGRAAAEQGKFWQYHDALYARHPEERGNQGRELLLEAARGVGLDMARFEVALDSQKLRADVQADYEFGQALGMPGTPAFLINGRLLFGSHPLSTYEQAIERARKQTTRHREK